SDGGQDHKRDEIRQPLGEDDGGRSRNRDAPRLVEQQRLEDLAELARGYAHHEPGQKNEGALGMWHPDVDATEIVLPPGVAQDVVAARECEGDGEEPSVEGTQAPGERVYVGIERKSRENEAAD